VFEKYGFSELQTPALEYKEVLTGKMGEEAERLMYLFKDQGERDVGLRYDLTVPLARVMGNYPNLTKPFKRYQIQNVWRAENPQRGRFREFLQCDIDTVGTANINADLEIIICVAKCLEILRFRDFKILINDRNVFTQIDIGGTVSQDELQKVYRSLDKIKKIGEEGVKENLIESGFSADQSEAILKNANFLKENNNIVLLKKRLDKLGLKDKYVFAPTLARGLDYYTGLIFEIEIEGYSAGSVAGGGRYDELIGMFTDKKIPAVGGSLGFDRLIDAMNQLNLFPKDLITSKALVLNLPNFEEKALEVADKLRENNINTEVYLDSNVEKGKQFNYAEKKGIPYTIVPNENETFTLGWKNENGEIEKVENITFDNLLEHLRS